MQLLLYFLLSFFLMQNTGCFACIDAERTALLAFKSKLMDPGNLLSTWKGQNCCSWKGVTCHNQSGHVLKLNLRYSYMEPEEPYLPLNGEMDPSFVSLRNLTHLDLSGNDFNESRIPNFIGQFENLVYLNLSSTYFFGEIPTELENLKKLRFLDMSDTRLNGTIPQQLGNISTLSFLSFGYSYLAKIENIEWISKLNSLQHLDLSFIDMLGSTDWFHVFNQLNNLKVLILERCNLPGIPTTVASLNLTSLKTLDLSSNSFDCPFPNWLKNLTSISHLDLSNSGFHGPPTNAINLSKLIYLDLSNNQLEGIISQNLLENLKELQVLYLSLTMLKLAISPHWLPKFQLTSLELQSCDVGPSFPSWLKSQTQMNHLSLQNSSINDVIPPWFWRPSFRYIDLSYNNLHGKLPHILQMPNLTILILASNNLGGPIISLPHDLFKLDISFNKFTGTLHWVSNQSHLIWLSARNNSFIGEIPSSICEMVNPEILDLSNNKLSGIFPNCVSKLEYLSILEISFNNLSGTIPNSICSQGTNSLLSLALHGNNLTGEIPTNLKYCQDLRLLDLGKNKLTGKVPKWLGPSFHSLAFLQLRENNFNGNISFELALLPKLQVLDIASNNLEGSIPDYFGNFSAMTSMPIGTSRLSSVIQVDFSVFIHINAYIGVVDYTYADIMTVSIKGETIEYTINLYLLNSIDLSGNNLSGSIPSGIVALNALDNLNLSRNNLNGKIPEKIGNMKSLECLDLSFNKLSGEIPQSISELTFMNHFNVSYNNLSGPIPVGDQLNTLNDSSIYVGNIFLCGGPTNRSCSVDETKSNTSSSKHSTLHALWMYLSIVAGFVVGWWVVLCVLLLHGTWSAAFFETVDYLYYKAISS